MINKLYKAVVALSIFAVAGTASAVPISGSIGFTGSYFIWDQDTSSATNSFTIGEEVRITSAEVTGSVTGSFSAEGITSSSLVAYSDITYNPTSAIAGLWNVGSFTFDLNSMSVDFISASNLILSGSGIITSTDAGLNDSYGNWNFSANSAGTNFTWSSSSAVPAPLTVYLLGSGLLGLVGIARRKKT